MKRETWGRWVLFVLSLPLMIGWLFPLLMCFIIAASWRSLRIEPTLVLSAEWKPWAAKIWRFSTTLFRGIIYQPGRRDASPEPTTRIERHEHVHVRQFEDMAVAGLMLALMSLFFPASYRWLILWIAAPAMMGVQWLTAWLRGGHAYRDAEMERAAYAITDPEEGHAHDSDTAA